MNEDKIDMIEVWRNGKSYARFYASGFTRPPRRRQRAGPSGRRSKRAIRQILATSLHQPNTTLDVTSYYDRMDIANISYETQWRMHHRPPHRIRYAPPRLQFVNNPI